MAALPNVGVACEVAYGNLVQFQDEKIGAPFSATTRATYMKPGCYG